jgi:ABC-type amino acid transport system permease subunit
MTQTAATTSSMTVRHLLLPAIAPLAIVGLYFTPVSLIGCAHRGLLALMVAGVSAIAAFVTIAFAVRGRARGDQASSWWILSALILTLPLVLLLGPLG